MKKIGIISSDPKFLGGVSLYTRNIIKSLKKNSNYKIFWIYRGNKNKLFKKEGINFIEFESKIKYPLDEILFNLKVRRFLNKNHFDIINSHAYWGFWLKFYKKNKNQKIIHTYHGVTYNFYKNHFSGPSFFRKMGAFFSMGLGFLMERPPWKRADEIICVSNHVKEELINLYGKRENVHVVRTGIDLKKFMPMDKNVAKKKLKLEKNNIYGLYVGRGGFWTKGLDRVVNISEEIYKSNKNFRLIVIGSDEKKVGHIVNKEFVILLPVQSRERMPYYYNASDVFFCLSRYEGGAPTLVTSEAMASGCFVVCSEDSKQEIIENEKNGLVIQKFDEKSAEKILNIIGDRKKKQEIIKNARNSIKELSLNKWGKIYVGKLLY